MISFRRFTAIFLILSLMGDTAFSNGLFPIAQIRACPNNLFTASALSEEPEAACFRAVLEKTPRFSLLRIFGQRLKKHLTPEIPFGYPWSPAAGIFNPVFFAESNDNDSPSNLPGGNGDSDPEDEAIDLPASVTVTKAETALQYYLEEHDRRRAELRSYEKTGFRVPSESFVFKSFDARGKARPYGNYGVLAFPHPDLVALLRRSAERFPVILRKIIDDEIRDREKADQAYESLMSSLVFPNPHTYHLTVAPERPHEADFRPRGLKYRQLNRNTLKRTERISRVRRRVDLHYNGGKLVFLGDSNPSIAALLEPDTAEDLQRYYSIKLSFGKMTKRSDAAHISIIYLRGKKQPDGTYGFSPKEMHWIAMTMDRIEAEKAGTSLAFPISEMVVNASEDHNHPQVVRSFTLMDPLDYSKSIKIGQDSLTKVLSLPNTSGLSGSGRDGIPYVTKLEALRGFFRHDHLWNLRAFFVAIALGYIDPTYVHKLLTHSKRLNVVDDSYDETTRKATFRVTAHFDRPGLILAISLAIDQIYGVVTSMDQGDITTTRMLSDDPADARFAINFTIEDMSLEDWNALKRRLRSIPDIGHEVFSWPFVRRFFLWWTKRQSNMEVVTVEVQLPPLTPEQRMAKEESRRTRMLMALMELDPHSDLQSFKLEREKDSPMGPKISMIVLVPKEVKPYIVRAINTAVGEPCAKLIERKKERIKNVEPPQNGGGLLGSLKGFSTAIKRVLLPPLKRHNSPRDLAENGA